MEKDKYSNTNHFSKGLDSTVLVQRLHNYPALVRSQSELTECCKGILLTVLDVVCTSRRRASLHTLYALARRPPFVYVGCLH